MDLSAERDAEIGRDTYRRLHRLNERLARAHALPEDRTADFLLAGVLFLAADQNDCSLMEAAAFAQEIARSVAEDDLPEEPRH